MRTSRPRDFAVPPDRIATGPPETRGVARDEVRLLVATADDLAHAAFPAIGRFLRPGDLVVVNTSSTRPAAIDGVLAERRGGVHPSTRNGQAADTGRVAVRRSAVPDSGTAGARWVVVHLSTDVGDGVWVVELREPDGSGPILDAEPGQVVALAGGGCAALLRPADSVGATDGGYCAALLRPADGTVVDDVRLWRARLDAPGGGLRGHMATHGRPITYGRDARRWPLDSYQTVFARREGSAEMPSAARPFSDRVITDLVARGIAIAPVTLHAGVSSLDAHEPPGAEWYEVPATTAARVGETRARGGRVVAVGTTVTRALETVAGPDGTVTAGAGWTDLVLGPARPARVVDGLLTGWHEADASHLLLLDAVAGAELVDRAYTAALAGPYLWHEFGDVCLLLRGRRNARR